VFAGYLDESKNQDIWMKDDWFNTGDLGRQDADGFFWLTGRAKDLIIRGGHNIDPAMIEEPLYQIEGVQVAAAVGRPDPHAGEVPVAFVQLQQGVELTPEEILAQLQEKIGERAAIPKEVFILDNIPLTPIGKIFKPDLRRNAIQYIYEKELTELADTIASAQVSVRDDPLHGSFAEISVSLAEGVSREAAEDKIKEVLARYTVKYDLTLD
jgi:fatty-acyl-CoA synthase